MFKDFFTNRQPDLTLEPGQRLFNEGDRADKAFIVSSGTIELYVKDNLLRAMGPGDILGEMALVDDDTRQASAVAGAQGTALFSLDKDEFYSLSSGNPEFSTKLMKVISSRLREMNRDFLIHKSTLENMSDGVLTLDLTGNLIACNDAAAHILGIADAGDDLIGKTIDEIFESFDSEVNEDFFQLILDAIGASDITQNRVVKFYNHGQIIKLSMTTSFLQTDKSGHAERNGVIAVFRDITEIERLRDAEAELSEELKAQHEQLQKAFISIEENNQALEANLKKIQMLRVFATAFVVILFLVIGLYSWNKRPSFSGVSSDAVQRERRDLITITATPKQLSTIGSIKAEMLPVEEIQIKSSVSGVVETVFFVFGQPVVEGYKLLAIDSSQIRSEIKKANNDYIEASDALLKIEKSKEKPDKIKLRQVRSVYDQSSEIVGRLEGILKNSEIMAPSKGIVVQPARPVALRQGAQISAGETLVTIANLNAPSFVAYISREDLPKIKIGQKVSIAANAFKGTTLDGEVTAVSPEEMAGEKDAQFVVEVKVSNFTPEQKALYRSGAAPDAKVEIFDKEDALFVPISAVRVDGKSKWLMIWDKKRGKTLKVAVKTGTTTLDSVEILGGLNVGDEVVVR